MQRFSLSRRSARREIHGWIRPLKLVLVAMAGTLLLYAQTVSAIGVGEPRFLSSLFQPLRIDIPLEADGSDPESVHVQVSIIGDSGGDGAPTTASLHREWLVDEQGHPFLRVTSPQPVHEPMLTLRVDVGNAALQVRRDLTLLFDPPTAPADAIAVATRVPEALPPDPTPRPAPSATDVIPREVASAVAAAVAAPDQPSPRSDARPPRKKLVKPSSATVAAATSDRQWQQLGPVEPGDTLEMLSKRVRNGADIPLPLVSALLRWLNPDSFKSTTGEPIPGAALKFPKPEQLAAQLSATGSIAAQLDAAATAPLAEGAVGEAPAITPGSLRMATMLSPQSLQLALEIDARRLAQPAVVEAPVDLPTEAVIASTVVATPPAAPALSSTPGDQGGWSGGSTVAAVMASGLLVFLMLKVVAGTPLAIGTSYSPSPVLSYAAAQESERLFGDPERLPDAVAAHGDGVPLSIPKRSESAAFVAAAAPTPPNQLEPDAALRAASVFVPVVTPPDIAEAPATWDLAQFDLQENDDLNPPDNRRTH